MEHCLDPPFRMGALTAAAAGSTNCSGCWENDGRLLTAEYPFSGDYAGVERAIFFNVLPSPASKDWFTQETVVWPCSNLGQFCRAILAAEVTTGWMRLWWHFSAAQLLPLPIQLPSHLYRCRPPRTHTVISCVQTSVLEYFLENPTCNISQRVRVKWITL